MFWLLALAVFVVVNFGFVLLFGAPYLPTLAKQVDTAVTLANLKPGQTLLELGCGDGRVMIAAAKRGVKVIGYELNPIMAAVAKVRTWPYRKNTKVVWGNFWAIEWPEAQAIFTFLLPRYMGRLDKKVAQFQHKPVKLVSFAFVIPGKKPLSRKSGMFLYQYK